MERMRAQRVCVCVVVYLSDIVSGWGFFIDSDERDATFFDRGLEPIEPSDSSRGTSCNVIMTNSMEKGWGKDPGFAVVLDDFEGWRG